MPFRNPNWFDKYRMVVLKISREEELCAVMKRQESDIEQLETGLRHRVAIDEREANIVQNYKKIIERKRLELAEVKAELQLLRARQEESTLNNEVARHPKLWRAGQSSSNNLVGVDRADSLASFRPRNARRQRCNTEDETPAPAKSIVQKRKRMLNTMCTMFEKGWKKVWPFSP
eukprot:GEMP01077228.1.p1 GENE.GEMP01077228.1~~GEMP01077228.1.p1  ORF type:complete len:174 (+),score=26.89 GEMP01077228.1:257-778(+)